MKHLLIAALMTLAALPAAAAVGEKGEMPDLRRTVHQNVMTVERYAGDLYRGRELGERGLMADDVVTVTLLPSSGRMDDASSRSDY